MLIKGSDHMNFRTILAFIIIAFVSSLLNKNKTPTKPTTEANRPVPREPLPVDRPSGTTENKRKGFSGGLEGLFEEIKAEFERAQRGIQKEQVHSPAEKTIKEENGAKVKQKTHTSKDIRRVAGSVYEGEIGKEEIRVRFDKKSVLQGIIMSEVLQKPKSLER
ncbi:MAG: hypothetical protein ACOX0L_04360 [Natronincolaceae bacterium]|nr:hypothetical protein [Bacillota bacterium]